METIVRHEGRKILHSPQFAPRRRSLWHENATVEDSMARNGDCGGFPSGRVARNQHRGGFQLAHVARNGDRGGFPSGRVARNRHRGGFPGSRGQSNRLRPDLTKRGQAGSERSATAPKEPPRLNSSFCSWRYQCILSRMCVCRCADAHTITHARTLSRVSSWSRPRAVARKRLGLFARAVTHARTLSRVGA